MTTTNDEAETVVTTTVERSITRHLVRFQSWLIPTLLAIISFFVVQVLNTVNRIADDNQRFNTYILTSSEHFTHIETELKELKEWKDEHTKEVGQFWKDHGYMFKPAKRRDDENEND
jgi:hypothetical protein